MHIYIAKIYNESTRKPLLQPYVTKSILLFGKTSQVVHYQMLLTDIYQWIVTEYPYFASLQSKAWRNSIRHNLSLNECFIRQQKSENGRGYYWGIHPAAFDAFIRGDFRRRQARLRAKRADNLSMQSMPWMINTDLPFDHSLHPSPTYDYS